MVLSELLTDLRKLNRVDKLYVIQELVAELVQKEELSMQLNDEVLKKDAALARIRKRWDMLPMQLSDQVEMWKLRTLNS